MDPASEKPAKVKKPRKSRAKVMDEVYPVENKDYYVVRLDANDMCSPGWIMQSMYRSNISKDEAKRALDGLKAGHRNLQPSRSFWKRTWIVYPGERPNKKWGKVCP